MAELAMRPNSLMAAQQQRGATAVEFALVFPLLFALLYGVIVYAYLFVVQESITYAAQQGAASIHSVSPAAFGADVAGYEATVLQVAQCNAARSLQWLPEAQRPQAPSACDGVDSGGGGVVIESRRASGSPTVYSVDLRFSPEAVFPQVGLPFVGAFPPLPPQVVASASVLVGEEP